MGQPHAHLHHAPDARPHVHRLLLARQAPAEPRAHRTSTGSRTATRTRTSGKKPSILPSRASTKRCPGGLFSSGARANEILCKADQGRQRAVDDRFISGTTSALRSWLLTSGPMPFCLCISFSCDACPGICVPAASSRTVVFGSLGVGTGGRVVVGRIGDGLAECPSARISKAYVFGNLRVGTKSCILSSESRIRS